MENVDHNIIFCKLTKAEVYSRHPDTTTLWLAMEDYPGSRWTSPFAYFISASTGARNFGENCHHHKFCLQWMGPFTGGGGQGVRRCTGVPLLQTDSENRLSVPSLMPLIFFNALSSLPCIRNEVQCKHGTCPMIFVCNGSGNWYLPNGICWIFENNLLFWRICVKLSDFRCSAHINQYHTTFIPSGVIQSFLRW